MKKLTVGESYRYIGYTLTVTRREGDIIMAENPEYGIEVFKIHNRKAVRLPNGNFSIAGEFPPSTSQWGRNSGHWPSRHRHLAEKYFEKLVCKAQHYPEEKLKTLCLK